MRIRDAAHISRLIESGDFRVGTAFTDTTGMYEVTHITKNQPHDHISVYAVEFTVDDENGNITYPAGSERSLTHYDLTGVEVM